MWTCACGVFALLLVYLVRLPALRFKRGPLSQPSISCYTLSPCGSSYYSRTLLSLVRDDSDDDRPLLEYKEDVLKRTVSVKSLDEIIPQTMKAKSFASSADEAKESKKPTTAKVGSKTFGSLSMEDLNSDIYVSPTGKVFKRGVVPKKEDLNGIQPLKPFVFSVGAAAMSFAAWQASTYLAAHFAIQFIDSELYPVQRVAIVGRNLIVGIFTLFTGFSGVIAVGLILLGIQVSLGVANGSLDPNKEREDDTKKKLVGDVKDLRVDDL